MRALITVVMLSAGCNSLLGISDPKTGPGDGGPDGVIDSSIDAPPPCTTSIALGAEITIDLGKPGLAIGFGDFDNGGVDDVAIAMGDEVQILHGDNLGNFGTPVSIPTAASDLVIEDYDIVTSADDDFALYAVGGTSVIIRLQNRANDPPVEDEQPLTGPFTNLRRVLAGELGGNLQPDLLVSDDGGTRVYTANVSAGTFTRSANTIAPGGEELVALRQIDGSGGADAVFLNAGTVKLSLQTASFSALSTIATGVASKGLAFGKFDGDALVDLVVGTPQGLVLYRQSAASPGTFTMHGVISPLTSAAPMHVLDLNDDGRDDIVVANAVILQCAPAVAGGVGVFTQVEAVAAAPPSVFRDVTNNGKADLLRLEGNTLKVQTR